MGHGRSQPRRATCRAIRGRAASLALFLAATALLELCPAAASAIDFADRRVRLHGFYEMQVRAIQEDLRPSNQLDLTQWAHVLDLELEADIAPDGFGPIDLLSAFVRVETRFDCVWTRGCGIFPSVNVYGDRPWRLPERVQNGRRTGFVGTQFTGNTDPLRYDSIFALDKSHAGGGVIDPRKAVRFWNTSTAWLTSRAGLGPDGLRGSFDRPGDDTTWPLYKVFLGSDEKRCLFGSRKVKAGGNPGFRSADLPWNPRCPIRPLGNLRRVPNPWSPLDPNDPVLGGAVGSAALPYRPAPLLPARGGNGDRSVAQGLWYPNAKVQQRIRNGDYGETDQNFDRESLQWNHGGSQQQTGELKEAYLDIETFDSRLWLRVGRQTIVWGKTELFRNQDRFNPQDLALSSLPTLEESRIPLWAVRAVWSFYEVGPFQDVRAELAMNFDKFEPADIGRCGEPYAALPVCDKTFGLLLHGLSGIGLAGEIRPQPAWKSLKGIELGGRLEWRYDRFSFALTDFWGYRDFPFLQQDFKYMRNVDPLSGRPREANLLQASCPTGTEPACLQPGEALTRHHANQSVFAWLCAATVGLAVQATGATECPVIGILNSQTVTPVGRLATAFSNILAGQAASAFPWQGISKCGVIGGTPNGANCANQVLARSVVPRPTAGVGGTPLVPLSLDVADSGAPGLGGFLTAPQQALLGCGPFYQTDCDVQGIDLLNAEASALMQSWPSFPGTDFNPAWITTDASAIQPGTVGFVGGTRCTRVSGGRISILPGCRGPFTDFTPDNPLDAYDPAVDGGVGNAPDGLPIVQPFTGQRFQNEMAVVSWNFLMLLTGLGAIDPLDPARGDHQPVGAPVAQETLDISQPFALGRCSFAQPGYCQTLEGILNQVAIQRPSVRAGGNGRFGRVDFLWHSGFSDVLRYQRTNVLGFSLDFAEDTTKSSWNLEFTWEGGVPVTSTFRFDQLENVDLFNLTISVDRPTFVNFLNANRTFFINSQLFIQYTGGYRRGMTANGPFNLLWVLAIDTGYFQDRLLPSASIVWDLQSNSGAFLPQVSYRLTENFSATFGVALFAGRFQSKNGGVSDAISPTLTGRHASRTFVENGLSVVRERDEVFLRIRYTF